MRADTRTSVQVFPRALELAVRERADEPVPSPYSA